MNTTPVTGTATDTDTGPGTATDDMTTNEPTATDPTAEPTTDEPTTDPTATDPTADPTTDTAGDDGLFCQEACAADADCTLMGMDQGFTCVDGRCSSDVGKCDGDAACQATFSGWITSCASDAECLMGQLCIDVGGGKGLCATPPSMFLTCAQIMQEEVMVPPIGGGPDVVVCANTSFECNDDGFCENPCSDNAECAVQPGLPQCNLDTGKCECTADADCAGAGVDGYAVCIDGRCGCGKDEDCAGNTNADVCNANGACGCSAAAVCTTKTFDGTMSVCEGA